MNNKKHNLGLSIIEMIVTISVFVVVISAVTTSVIAFYRANAFNVQQAFAVESARRGIERMVRDIRESSFSDEGAYPIISMSTTSFYFYSDVDRDDDIERIRFFLDDTLLQRGLTEATGTPPTYDDDDEVVSTISDNVRNHEQSTDIFEYYDEDGAEILTYTNVSDVRFVVVNLIVNINPIRLPNEFTLRSSATLRNIKPNL